MSDANHWVRCAQWSDLTNRLPPSEDSDAAREGTAAHHVMERAMRGEMSMIGQTAPNGVAVTQEMIDGANLLLAHLPAGAEFYTETTVRATAVSEACDGRLDVLALDRAAKYVRIYDYKFGHRLVDETDHWPLVLYAQGVRELFNLSDEFRYELTIVQPRRSTAGGLVRNRSITSADLDHLVSVAARAAAALRPGSPLAATPGTWCRTCPRRHACRALQDVSEFDESSTAEPRVLDAHSVGVELTLLRQLQDRLEARISGLEAHATAMIRAGRAVSGWTLGPANTRERWQIPATQVIEIGKMLGANFAKPQEAITPNQARKLPGVDPAVIDSLATNPPGKLELKPLTAATVARAFKRS